MRTTKLNMIELDAEETIEVHCGGATLRIRCVQGVAMDKDAQYLEVVAPSGQYISNMRQLHNDGSDDEVFFMNPEWGADEYQGSGLQELAGPVDFIVFHNPTL